MVRLATMSGFGLGAFPGLIYMMIRTFPDPQPEIKFIVFVFFAGAIVSFIGALAFMISGGDD